MAPSSRSFYSRMIAAGCCLILAGALMGYLVARAEARVRVEHPVVAVLTAVDQSGTAVSFQTHDEALAGESEAMPVTNLSAKPLEVGQTVTGYVVRIKIKGGYTEALIAETAR